MVLALNPCFRPSRLATGTGPAYTKVTVRRAALIPLTTLLLAAQSWGQEKESFWVLRFAPGRHPFQEQLLAQRLAGQERVVLYLAEGTSEPTQDQLPPGGYGAVLSTVERALASLPSPRDGEDPGMPLAILVAETGWPEAAFFSPFDLLAEEEALAYGFHSNRRPVVYCSFPFREGQAWRNLAALVEQVFLLRLLPKEDPFPTATSEAAASWFAYSLGLVPPRFLWGDASHQELGPPTTAPAAPKAWTPLFIAFLEAHLGPGTALELTRRQNAPTGPYLSLVTAKGLPSTLEDLYAAYLQRLWQPNLPSFGWDQALAASPRPVQLARLSASRPISGHGLLGVGGSGLLVVEGDGGKSLPLALQGAPTGRWVGVAYKVSAQALGHPQRVLFDRQGFAQVELPPLGQGERFLVLLGLAPDPWGQEDASSLPLYWGLAWSPKLPLDRRWEDLRELAGKKLGEQAPARRTRVLASLRALAGEEVGQPPLPSRYAWHPQAEQVVDFLQKQARQRGLEASKQAFLRTTPWGASAWWQNLVIQLPGGASRRLPLVLAAHWDACQESPWASYRDARSVADNALGVVTALEVASLLRNRPHQLPVVVAFLAGGCQDAAGAQALLAALGGRVALWLELEQLMPQGGGDPSKLAAYVGETTSTAIPRLTGLFRRWGFSLDLRQQAPFPHVGTQFSKGLGITLAHQRAGEGPGKPLPGRAELANVSPDQVLLLSEALAELVQELGGK